MNAVQFWSNFNKPEYYNAKLDVGKVVIIRETYAEGVLTQQEIADIVGVSRSLVKNIVTGRAWKQAGGPITKNYTMVEA